MRHPVLPSPNLNLTDAALYQNVEPRLRSLQMRPGNNDLGRVPKTDFEGVVPLTPTQSTASVSTAELTSHRSNSQPSPKSSPKSSVSSPGSLLTSTSAVLSSSRSEVAEEDLPATQPLDEDDREIFKAGQRSGANMVWATLVSQNKLFRSYNLINPKTTFGRATCTVDCNISEEFNTSANKEQISRHHFTIEMDPTTRDVFLLDFSSNGTLINDEGVVGKGKRRPLVHGDVICLLMGAAAFKFLLTEGSFCRRETVTADFNMDGNKKMSDARREEVEIFRGRRFPKELTERYIIKDILGHGGCARVYVAYDRASPTYEKVAVKELECTPRHYERESQVCPENKSFKGDASFEFRMETDILKKLHHPCIIGMRDAFKTKEAYYIVMDLARGGELYSFVIADYKNNQLYESVAKLQMYQILRAIQYTHDQGIAHRDLKLENILLATPSKLGLIKISDFGLSKEILPGTTSLMRSFVGTPHYLAPELVLNEESKGMRKYTKKVDMWALGCILYSVLSGNSAFDANNTLEIKDKIKKNEVDMNYGQWKIVSDEAKDLVMKLLEIDESKRMTCTQALGHNWFQADPTVVSEAERLLSGTVPEADLSKLVDLNAEAEKQAKISFLEETIELDDDDDEQELELTAKKNPGQKQAEKRKREEASASSSVNGGEEKRLRQWKK